MAEIVTEEIIPNLGSSQKCKTKLYINKNTYYGKCLTSSSDKSVHDENSDSQVKTEMYYINNTSRDITIMGRDGLAFIIKSRPMINKSNLIIRKVYTMRGLGLKSAIKCINSIKNIEAEDLEQIKENFTSLSVDDFTDIKIVLDYEINIDVINSNREKTIYHYQTDLIVSLKDVVDVPSHPYSSRFANVGSFGINREYKDLDKNNLQIKIRYVDHSPHSSAKYINILGQVKVLYPEKDAPFRMLKIRGVNNKNVELTTTDYIEIFSTVKNDINSSSNSEGIKVERYSLQEAKELFGIYDTFIDAVSNGNIDAVRKKELTDLEYNLNLSKIQIQTDKAQFDRESDERKRELTELQNKLQQDRHLFDLEKQDLEKNKLTIERELNDIKNMKLILDTRMGYQTLDVEMHKQDMNLRMQKRKDTIDFIKFVPGLVVAVTGLIGLYVKFNNKKD